MNPMIHCMLPGLEDVGLVNLEGKTPWDKAHHPHLDYLMQNSTLFSITNTNCLGVDNAFLTFVLQNPKWLNISTAIFEATLFNASSKLHNTYLLARFVFLVDEVIVDSSHHFFSEQEARALCSALNERFESLGLKFILNDSKEVIVISDGSVLEGFQGMASVPHPDQLLYTHIHQLYPGLLTPEQSQLLYDIFQTLEDHEINQLRKDLEEPLINGLIFEHGGGYTKSLFSYEPSTSDQLFVYTFSTAVAGACHYFHIPFMKLLPEKKRYEYLIDIMQEIKKTLGQYQHLVLDLRYLWESTYKKDLLEKIKTIEFLDKFFVQELISFCNATSTILNLGSLVKTDMHLGTICPGTTRFMQYIPYRVAKTQNESLISSPIDLSNSNISLDRLLLRLTHIPPKHLCLFR